MQTNLIMLPQPILVSDEEIKENDWYYTEPYSNLSIRKCIDSNYNFTHCKKIIAGIPELPLIDFSALSEEDCKKIGWVDVEKLAENYAKEQCEDMYHNVTLSGGEWGWETALDFKNGFKTCQSLNEKKFSEEDMVGFTKWLDENWRRGKTKKGTGWFHAGDFYKQSKPIKTRDLMSKYLESLSQPKVFDVEVEMDKRQLFDLHTPQYERFVEEPKINNNSIKVIKVL